jgi:hypothetical protein
VKIKKRKPGTSFIPNTTLPQLLHSTSQVSCEKQKSTGAIATHTPDLFPADIFLFPELNQFKRTSI